MFRPVAALAFLVALPAAAQDLRMVESWPHDDWITATMLNVGSDRRFCAAETTSADDQVFRIVLYEDDDAFLEILDTAWAFPDGKPIRFSIVVDGDSWALEGQGWYQALTWDLLDADDRSEMFSRLSNGSALDILMPDGGLGAQFSLAGAGAAIVEANHCWAAQRAGEDYRP